MKVNEILESMEERAAQRQERLKRLKADVESGNMPVIQNASGVHDQSQYTMGDLEELGWMTKTYTHDSQGEVDGWDREYHGPKPVKVQTMGAKELQILKPGETI